MKITKRQLRRIIREAVGHEDLSDADRETIGDLGGMYSDMHKELYGRRPKHDGFVSVEEAEAAVEKLWGEYAAFNRQREDQQRQDLEFEEAEARIRELLPDEYDYEHVPHRSSMRRRVESRNRLKRIVAK
jgi:hypothetical protein|tara:strand:- start:34 stop:423 length:390 start_codon:yes stop_codon:yes gene_type:complete